MAARSELLSAAECAYLGLIEADGRLDGAASVLGRFRLSAPVPDSVIDILLSKDNISPLTLLRAAAALVDLDDTQWLWAAEQCILQALWLTDGDGDRIEAACLLAAGQFYASNDRAAAVRFLEAARRAADGHRSDWPLPADDVWRFDRTQSSKRYGSVEHFDVFQPPNPLLPITAVPVPSIRSSPEASKPMFI